MKIYVSKINIINNTANVYMVKNKSKYTMAVNVYDLTKVYEKVVVHYNNKSIKVK
jgi:hypothetical protein